MNLTRPFLSLLIILSLLMFCSCGYNFRADGKPVGIEIDSIAIPMVASSSSEKGFEADFTGVLRKEFISHSSVPLKNRDHADKVLEIEIYDIVTQPLTYDSKQSTVSGKLLTHETTSRRRLILRLNARLTDRVSGKTIWYDNRMTEEASFAVTADPLVNRKNQREALIKIAGILSRRIYNSTMERF